MAFSEIVRRLYACKFEAGPRSSVGSQSCCVPTATNLTTMTNGGIHSSFICVIFWLFCCCMGECMHGFHAQFPLYTGSFFRKKIIHLHIFSIELHDKHIKKIYMVQMLLQRMSSGQEDTSTRTKFSMVFHLLCHQSLVHDVEHTSYFRFFFQL